MPYYAVVVGRNPGIYSDWDQCKQQINKFPCAWYKRFKTLAEAEKCMKGVKTPILENQSENSSNREPSDIHTIQNKVEDIRRQIGKCVSYFARKVELLSYNIGVLDVEVKSIISRTSQPSSEQSGDTLVKSSETDSSTPNTDEQSRNSDPNHPRRVEGIPHDSPLYQPPLTTNYPFSSQHLNTCQENVVPLIEDNEGYIDVYIDGAVTRNGKERAVGGIGVWFNHGHPLNIAAPLEGYVTNTNAEIQAATRAVQQAAAAGLTKLNIHTDSMFMINCMTKWISRWKKNQWVASKGSAVKNRDGLEKLDEALKSMEGIKWTHTRSHQGNEGNENADILAHAGVSLNGFKKFADYLLPHDLWRLSRVGV